MRILLDMSSSKFYDNIYSITLIWIAFIPYLLQAQHPRRFVAEWEPAYGALIRWPLGIPADLVVELAKDDSLYVLVANETQKQQAMYTFSSWNVNLNHCRFIFAPTNSHWTRDWGPHYVFNEDGTGGIADSYFDGYPWVPGCFLPSGEKYPHHAKNSEDDRYQLDNAVNAILADTFNCPLISLPIYLTGGNVMVDGRKTAIATQQMLDENSPTFSKEEFMQIASDSLGITNFIIVENPEINGIQHIDCYAKFLDEETILVKEVPAWHPEFLCCEALANHLAEELNAYGEPYNIVRIFCGPYSGNSVAAYTNSLILNTKVLVPLFGIPEDQQALQVYEQAMPGYEVIGFEWSAWYHYDALHCRTMGIFDRHMIRIEHKALRGEVLFDDLPLIKTRIIAYPGTGLVDDSLRLYWREKNTTNWYYEPLEAIPGTDSLMAYIPGAEISLIYDYYIAASDSSGRNETHPRSAPHGFHTFTYAGTFTGARTINQRERLNITPNPFSEGTYINFSDNSTGTITVWSLTGVKIREWEINKPGEGKIFWDGKDRQGIHPGSGIYIVVYNNQHFTATTKCVLIH
jgi:agmatine deiminase